VVIDVDEAEYNEFNTKTFTRKLREPSEQELFLIIKKILIII
jgi:hypothetical protein